MTSPHAEQPPASAGEPRYGFHFAGLALVPAARVLTELVADAQVFPVPRAPAALAGVINLHGTIVPLFDARLVGQPRPDIRPTRQLALVFDRDEQRAGLLVAAAPQLLRLAPAPQAQRPAGLLQGSLRQAWEHRAGADAPPSLWWEFDHRAAFALLAQAGAQEPPSIRSAALAGTSLDDLKQVIA
jgi:hypothetical protein